MPVFVRKFNKAKWENSDPQEIGTISADAITLCLKTSGNTLSLWEIDKEDSWHKAVIAFVSGCEKIETMDFIFLDPDYFDQNSIEIVNSSGRTAFKEMADKHYDLRNLTYSRLGTVACHIAERLAAGKCQRITRASLKAILKEAIESGNISCEDLGEKLRNELAVA